MHHLRSILAEWAYRTHAVMVTFGAVFSNSPTTHFVCCVHDVCAASLILPGDTPCSSGIAYPEIVRPRKVGMRQEASAKVPGGQIGHTPQTHHRTCRAGRCHTSPSCNSLHHFHFDIAEWACLTNAVCVRGPALCSPTTHCVCLTQNACEELGW